MSLSTNVSNLATRVATEIKAVRTLVNGNAGDLSSLTTTAKSSLVAAINELDAAIAEIDLTGLISDTTTTTTSTWSSTKISTAIDAAVADLVDGAPALLDTLNELAAALGDDENFAVSIATSISNAQTAAEDYADGLASNYDVAGAAAQAYSDGVDYTNGEIATEVTNRNTAISNAIDALDTDDIEEGATNKYYSDTLVDSHLSATYPIEYTGGDISLAVQSAGGLATSEGGLYVNRTVVDAWYDAAGAASSAEAAANLYTDGEISTLETAIGDTSVNYVTTFEAGLV